MKGKMSIQQSISNLIFLLVGAVFLIISYREYVEWNVDLTEVDKISGVVTNSYQTKIESGGKYGPDEVFVVTLNIYPKKLGFYFDKASFPGFRDKLNVGDTITVFLKSTSRDSINLNVYQINKGEEIILDYEQYRSNQLKLLPLFVIVGSAIVILSIFRFFRP